MDGKRDGCCGDEDRQDSTRFFQPYDINVPVLGSEMQR